MEKQIVVLCRENDCAIKIHLVDDDVEGTIDEFEFGIPDAPVDGWLVIGLEDMQHALQMAGYKLVKG